jgi:DUF971 family protein
MSIWDYMKPAAAKVEPQDIALRADGGIDLRWSDGRSDALAPRHLRLGCPCAACVDEWTHKPTLDPNSVPESVRVREALPVGNYALQLRFTDGHETGIYTWELLRQLGDPNSPATSSSRADTK